MHSRLPPPRQSRIKERSITTIYTVFLGVVFIVAVTFMVYYFKGNPDILFSSKKSVRQPNKIVHLSFQDVDLLVPKYMLGKIQRSPLRRILSIRLHIPLQPVDGKTNFIENADLDKWLLVTIEKSKSHFSQAKWLKEIYRIYFNGPAILHSSGLYLYKFRPDSPYNDMQLFVDDLNNPVNMIKCNLEASGLGYRMCESQSKISNKLSIFYRFPKQRLGAWRKNRETIDKFVASSIKPAR